MTRNGKFNGFHKTAKAIAMANREPSFTNPHTREVPLTSTTSTNIKRSISTAVLRLSGGPMDVFQLSLFLQVPEDRVMDCLVCEEYRRLISHVSDPLRAPEMMEKIARARGIETQQVGVLLLDEAWEEMISERVLRKWPHSASSATPKKEPKSVQNATVPTALIKGELCC